MNNLTVASAALGNFVHYLSHTRLANTLTQSMNNISAHYDLGNELFTAFLDDSMMYSSAVWAAPEESLYDAQMRKVNMLINKARLGAGDEVLEIGTGWGTLAIEVCPQKQVVVEFFQVYIRIVFIVPKAVRQRGCRVTTVTLSKEQKRFTEDRLAKLPVEISSRIQVLLCDYRRLPELFPNKRFDKIISIEMIEAVGPEFLTTYFQVCHQMLHPEHGIMAFQCITMPESRYESYKAGVDFIQRYIFPGGHCPSVTALVQSVHEGSAGGHLMVDDLENIGPHYARTLRVWRERFLQNFDSKLKAFEKFTTRQKQLSTLTETISSWLPWTGAGPQEKVPFYSEEFKRKWVYYLSYCEAGFATRTLGNVQMVLTRVCNRRMLEGEEQVVL